MNAPLRTLRCHHNAAVWLLPAVLVLAIGGCGGQSDEDAVRSTMRDYLVAVADSDGAAACDLMAASARRELVESVQASLPELDATDCASAIEKTASLTDEQDLARLGDAKIATVTVDRDQATVGIQGASTTADLRRLDGRWRIIRLGFGETAGEDVQTPRLQ